MRFWRNLDDSKKLLIAGVVGVLVGAWAAPYFKGTKGSVGDQIRRMDIPQYVDPFGLLQGGEGDDDAAPRRRRPSRGEAPYSEASRQDLLLRGEGDHVAPPGQHLRLPPGAGNRGGYDGTASPDRFPRVRRDQPNDRTSNADGSPGDQQRRAYRRWRDCDGPPGPRQRCGPWQTGPEPKEE